MLEERYFTHKDATVIAQLLTTFFPETRFKVLYQGIYGEIGKKGKFAYCVIFKYKKYHRERRCYMKDLESLGEGIRELLSNEDEESRESVVSLIVSLISASGEEKR